jgi:hypothetical protein
MIRLATQYGITGNGLAKICDRLNIPYPPRGHWAKKAAGKKVIVYRLPEPKEGTPLDVAITATPPAPELPPEIREKVESATAPISVPEKLSRPHSIISGWLEDHERRAREARRDKSSWSSPPQPFSEVDRRKHRILDALFKALEQHGGKVGQGEQRELFCELNGEKIEFGMREKTKQIRRPLTEQEKRWKFGGDNDWKQELQPIGLLAFSIRTYLPEGLRSEWLEKPNNPMESLLPEIVGTFVAAGPMLAEQRRQREEEARQRQIAERERQLQRERRKQDSNRWRRFVEMAHQSRNAEIARKFVAALKESQFDPDTQIDGKNLAEWLAWAENWAVADDPLNNGPEKIFKEVSDITSWTYRD